ncbi:MAG: zf-HC2 domain-containing protein [Myxococcota bacterium]
MSCPDEAAWLLYVDGETGDAERRALETHLVSCRDCRRSVVALQDETSLLTDALHERERPARAPARAPAPEPGVAFGLPLTIAAVTAAFAVVGLLLDSRVPGGLDHLNPLRLKGAYEMAFDLVFLARDRAPGLIELALSIGVMASVSAILTLGVNLVYRRVYGAAAGLLLGLLLLPAEPAVALKVQIDEDTSVSSGQVVEESMFLSGERVTIDGVVQGDVWVGAERVFIGGTVEGTVYVMARDLEVSGTVDGNVVGAIEHARIDGVVTGSITAAAESLTLAADASVERDLSLVAESGLLNGRVGRDVTFGGEELELRAEVGRNVDVRWAQRVALRDAARVEGDAVLRLREGDDGLVRAPGAVVAGEVTVEELPRMRRHYLDHYKEASFYLMTAVGLVAGFLFGLLLRWIAPSLWESDLSTSPQFLRSLGYGFLVLVATPIAVVAMGLTVVGLPVAILTAFVYVVMFYSASLLVGAWIGRSLLPPREPGLFAWARSFFVGLAVLTVVGHLPFIGPPVMVVATLIGAGLFFEVLRDAAPLPE